MSAREVAVGLLARRKEIHSYQERLQIEVKWRKREWRQHRRMGVG